MDTDRTPLPPPLLLTSSIARLIEMAVEEDAGRGDPTTALVSGGGAVARVVCREPTVACGLDVAAWVLDHVDPEVVLAGDTADGDLMEAGETLLALEGDAGSILVAERVMLNFLGRMCGVAMGTRAYVEAVAGTGARVVDTRKTLPGWRVLDKYAVRVGGGMNHRMDLASGILIKDNHIAACGTVAAAVAAARDLAPHTLRVEVEVESLEDAVEALDAGAEVLLLDNMTPQQVAEVRAEVGQDVPLEVSGGITLETVRAFAEAGADIISVGALTHSVRAADLSLELRPSDAVAV